MIVIDARKAMDAGIGTYIQELVPRICNELKDLHCQLLVSPVAVSWAEKVKSESCSNLSFTIFDAAPFSIKEQFLFRRLLSKSMIFWATSMSHPLFYNGRVITTVHDVAQLALPSNMVGGLITKVLSKIFFKSILAYSKQIIFVSQFSQSEFTRYVGKPKQRTSVIHLGVNSRWFKADIKAKKSIQVPYFISVSSIRPHKNFSLLLKAFIIVARTIPHKLIIVGDKRGLQNIDSGLMQEVLNLGERIKFLGKISDEELRFYVANADAMVFPSLYEGFGLPPIEAMATGTPVICSSAASMQEVCGDAPIYFNPLKIDELVAAINYFNSMSLSDRSNLIKKGVERASNYSWDYAAKMISSVIKRESS